MYYNGVREHLYQFRTTGLTLTLPANTAGEVVPITGNQSLLNAIGQRLTVPRL
jgi:hypothetical protein